MESKKNTRAALADALRSLMRTRSFERITVRDIVERCGVGRQTFYYYFQDKYDLMNWIYSEEVKPYAAMAINDGDWSVGLSEMCRHMWHDKGFYMSALKTEGPNSFPAFFRQFVVDEARRSMAVIAGGREIDAEGFLYVAEFCSIALVGMLVEWARKGMKDDPAVFVHKMKCILDGTTFSQIYPNRTGD